MSYQADGDFTKQKKAFGTGQCVALVRALTDAPPSSLWREGGKLIDLLEANVYIAPGTAIATFSDGRYPNKSHGNHAAIFLRWVGNGARVFHQWKGKAPHISTLAFGVKEPKIFLRAESYSVVL
ncbi:BPSL0067 family protein [Massilia sp. TS11]|uniref:BPSL0067 family protein n=1 Tax=Massilia sp. TS11 TaxID=2908003 RepID=UPI001EDC0837|nr:BPSL0067 family protein [Massilia sp. TS11]MCG2585604.1 BPSL0067 family protein [Massilia sp. TS11]